MRVGVGATVLARGLAQDGVDGIGSYTRELMQRMAHSHDIALQSLAYSGPTAARDGSQRSGRRRFSASGPGAACHKRAF